MSNTPGPILPVAILFTCTSVLSGPPQATYEKPADQVFTYGSAEYTLRDQGNWSCKGKGCPAATEDFTVELTDGRTIVLGIDSSWHVMAKGEIVGTKDIKIDKVDVTVTAENIRVDAADIKARKDVRAKVAARIAAGAPKRRITAPKVLFCMDEKRIVPDVKQTRNAKGAWTATASITLSHAEVLALIYCAQQVVEDTAAAAGQPQPH